MKTTAILIFLFGAGLAVTFYIAGLEALSTDSSQWIKEELEDE